jgi:flagellar protein FlbD
MISVTKMDGTSMVLNAEWIQSVERTPDTVITLTTGMKILVRDGVEEIVEAFKSYKRDLYQKKTGETV